MGCIDRETCCAIGDASVSVGSHIKLIGTSAFEANRSIESRREEAEIGTSSVVISARIVVRNLTQRMVDVQVVGSVGRVPEQRVVVAGPLVRSIDRFEVPVGPEDEIVEDGDGEHVRHAQRIETDVAPVGAVQIGVSDVVEMSVGPEQFVGQVVDGESVGPGQTILVGHDAAEIGSVQSDATDVGLQVPRGEEEVAHARMHHDGARIRDAVRLQRPAVRSVQFGHFDVLRVTIQPVDLATHPIHSNTLSD